MTRAGCASLPSRSTHPSCTRGRLSWPWCSGASSETRFKLKAMLSFSQSKFETSCFQARVSLHRPTLANGSDTPPSSIAMRPSPKGGAQAQENNKVKSWKTPSSFFNKKLFEKVKLQQNNTSTLQRFSTLQHFYTWAWNAFNNKTYF